MNKVVKWIIAITVGVFITLAIMSVLFYFIVTTYNKKVDRDNQQVEGYIGAQQTPAPIESESIEQETKNYGIDVEELPTEEQESEIFVYWDPEDDKDQVYFTSSAMIIVEGFLPYDILGQLNVFLKEKLRGFRDTSSEMIIDDTHQSEFVSVIYFHTEKGKYTYRYNWEEKTQELLEDG